MTAKEVLSHEWRIGESVFMIGYSSLTRTLWPLSALRKPEGVLEFKVSKIVKFGKMPIVYTALTQKSRKLKEAKEIYQPTNNLIICEEGQYFGNIFLGDIVAEKQLKKEIKLYNKAVERKLEKLNNKEKELREEIKNIKAKKKEYSKSIIK